MILTSKNGKKWISRAMDKLHAYLNRAPILVSDITGTEGCIDGVFIIPENTKTKMFFPFDYDEDPKIWVHNIKEKLLEFYPRIVENVYKTVATSPKERAIFLERGGTLDEVPAERKEIIEQRLWRIDKIQVYKDIFILQLEGTRTADALSWGMDEPSATIQNRYKYQGGSSVFFLNKYRNNDFQNLVDAGEAFFNNSIFIDEVQQQSQQKHS